MYGVPYQTKSVDIQHNKPFHVNCGTAFCTCAQMLPDGTLTSAFHNLFTNNLATWSFSALYTNVLIAKEKTQEAKE